MSVISFINSIEDKTGKTMSISRIYGRNSNKYGNRK